MLGASPVAGAILAAKYWPNDGVTLRARRSRPRRWLSRTVVEARVQSVAISIAAPFIMRASSISACTVVVCGSSPRNESAKATRPRGTMWPRYQDDLGTFQRLILVASIILAGQINRTR